MSYDYRLCNVLLADGKRSEEHPELYVRQTPSVRVAEGEEGVLRFRDVSQCVFRPQMASLYHHRQCMAPLGGARLF